MSHAFINPSGLKRYLTCTPAAHLEKQFAEKGSSYAEEGTLAHEISAVLILRKLDRMIKKHFDEAIAKLTADPLYEPSMMDYCEDYACFVMEKYAEAQTRNSDAHIYIETRIDMTEWIPEGFGTGDCFIISDDILEFIDLKYGKGVPVHAEKNEQVQAYAIGAKRKFETMFDIQRVRMTIYQPRIDNIDTWETTVEELEDWANKVLKPGAAKAFKGEGEYVAGEHCRFCKAKAICRANAELNLKIAEHDFKSIDLLTDDEVAQIYKDYDRIKNWLEGVADYALAEAIKGKQYPGLKVIAGKANRKFTKIEELQELLLKRGYLKEDILTQPKLKGITDLTKIMGKSDFNKIVEPYLIQPQGKPALVPLAKPGKPWDPQLAAKDDFANLKIEDE